MSRNYALATLLFTLLLAVTTLATRTYPPLTNTRATSVKVAKVLPTPDKVAPDKATRARVNSVYANLPLTFALS